MRANDPNRRSWLDIPKDSDFSLQNLPFGVFSTANTSPRAGVAIGNSVLDLAALAAAGLLDDIGVDPSAFASPTLNAMMRSGKPGARALRDRVSDLLSTDTTELSGNAELAARAIVAQADVTMHLPVDVGDYTDFYSSEEHATNVGTMFRDPDNALLPNWKHLPVGYHGRASSIVLSGTDFHRPKGQTKPPDGPPEYGPCKLMDFELEMGFITFDGKPLGQSISTAEADDHIFGLVLFNDWSARDIQTWEYVPLGPFLAKNFASSISPWIVTLDALDPFRVAGPKQDPAVLPYLEFEGERNYDIDLQVFLQTDDGAENLICESNHRHLYWNMAQQLAHHTVNGCNVRSGDMMASGTISGPTPDSYGSMLELSWRGTKPLKMADGSERKFIQDGDAIIMRGAAEKDGVRVGFGEVTGRVLPAI